VHLLGLYCSQVRVPSPDSLRDALQRLRQLDRFSAFDWTKVTIAR
jgi:hypothetical protein